MIKYCSGDRLFHETLYPQFISSSASVSGKRVQAECVSLARFITACH